MRRRSAAWTSRLCRFGLWLLGIRHQRTAPFSSLQNGRIERRFGTLKQLWLKLQEQQTAAQDDREEDPHTFRTWYNHLRPNQSLDGLTPAEAWSGKEPARQSKPSYFEAWKGVLTGFYFPD